MAARARSRRAALRAHRLERRVEALAFEPAQVDDVRASKGSAPPLKGRWRYFVEAWAAPLGPAFSQVGAAAQLEVPAAAQLEVEPDVQPEAPVAG